MGALLAGARWLWPSDDDTEPECSVHVAVPADARRFESERAIDEALLVDLAVRSGWAESDAVVRSRLFASMRAAGEVDDSSALVQRAIALGLHLRDPIVHERLLTAAQRMLERSGEDRAPTDPELAAILETQHGDFQHAARWRLRHVFAGNPELASTVQRQLNSAQIAAGEPWRGAPLEGWLTATRIDAALGAGTAAKLEGAKIGVWSPPVASTYGSHFFLVEAYEPARRSTLSEARSLIEQHWQEEQRAQRLQHALGELREHCEISVEVLP